MAGRDDRGPSTEALVGLWRGDADPRLPHRAAHDPDDLVHLELPHRPPRTSPAPGTLQRDLLLDQTAAFDITAPEPIPELELDQFLPEEFDG